MYIILLVWAIIMLLGNLKSYKTLFQSNQTINNNANKVLSEAKNKLGQLFKPTMVGSYVIYAVFAIAFWAILATIVSNLYVTIFCVLIILSAIYSIKKIGEIADSEEPIQLQGYWRFLTIPVITVLIIIYIVVLLAKI